MAGFVAKGNNIYDGSAVVAVGQTIKNGHFVDLTIAGAGNTVALCVAAPTVAPYFVASEIDAVEEDAIADKDVVYVAGKYVKIKKLLAGEEFVVDSALVSGSPVVGDVCFAKSGLATKKALADTPVQSFQLKSTYTQGAMTMYHFHVID